MNISSVIDLEWEGITLKETGDVLCDEMNIIVRLRSTFSYIVKNLIPFCWRSAVKMQNRFSKINVFKSLIKMVTKRKKKSVIRLFTHILNFFLNWTVRIRNRVIPWKKRFFFVTPSWNSVTLEVDQAAKSAHKARHVWPALVKLTPQEVWITMNMSSLWNVDVRGYVKITLYCVLKI